MPNANAKDLAIEGATSEGRGSDDVGTVLLGCGSPSGGRGSEGSPADDGCGPYGKCFTQSGVSLSSDNLPVSTALHIRKAVTIDVSTAGSDFTTTTGNFKIITLKHMKKMKNNAIFGDIGNFYIEFEMEKLDILPGIEVANIKPQFERFVLPDGHGLIVLASGRLLILGCATGYLSFVMSCSFTNQVLSQLDLLTISNESKGYKNDVYSLPKDLDVKVAAVHLPALGADLSKLSKEQADYIGVKVLSPLDLLTNLNESKG